MRVLHVLDHSLPLHSGYTFRTRAILKAQQRLGLDVRGVTSVRHGPVESAEVSETVDGLTFFRTAGDQGKRPVIGEIGEIQDLSRSIRQVAQSWRPDIIHAHSPALCGAGAWAAARQLNIPFVYEIRAFWEDAAVGNRTGREGSLKYRLTKALETQVVRRADAVFTICHGLRDDLIARGINPSKLGIMPNGVDLTLFGSPPARDTELAEKLGVPADGPVIGFVGSFYDYEGLDDLIAAMPLLRQRYPGAKLLLVGGGEMDQQWRSQATQLPDPEAVIFTGRVPHSEVDRYYSLIDILAYPRKHSRLTDLVTPLKPLEAMAQRRIVAASDVGGHRELIDHAQTGYLFPPDDPAACADALADVIEDKENWQAIRLRGLDHVRTKHDWSNNAQNYLDVYQALLAGDAQSLPPAGANPAPAADATFGA